MREITIIDMNKNHLTISCNESITVTLPSSNRVTIIDDVDIERAFENWRKFHGAIVTPRSAFFAGAKFAINGDGK